MRPLAHDTLLAKLVSERPIDERERARFVALVGAPGSGKSELVRRLAFEEPLTQRYDVVLYTGLRERAPKDAEAVLNEWLVALGKPPMVGRIAGAALRNRLCGRRVGDRRSPLEAPVHPLRQARKKCRSRPGRTASTSLLRFCWVHTLTGSQVDRKLNRDRFRTIVTAMILMLGLSLALGLGRR